ncbi:SpoIIE family protein phosphatase [Balneolales bacterium ANBcel1]|nr:SpoIIE family protein phosphatase [Balneolales bacterium ANBcel1]
MSLDNETRRSFNRTRTFYREYTRGMTAERLGKEFQADSQRLMELYYDAVGIDRSKKEKQRPVQVFKLIGSLISRLTPARRLAFGFSIGGLALYMLSSGLIATLMLPLSFLALVLLLLLELLEKSDVKREIDLARDIQISLLPGSNFRYEDIEFASFASTASEVGGDYVDVIRTERGTYYIIADVSGKGLSAALYMVRIQALVHLIIEKLDPDPSELFIHLNDYIKSGKKDKTFVTACAALFPSDGSPVKMCRAGHNPPLFYDASRDAVSELRSQGLALGMASTTIFRKQLQEISLVLDPGDHLLFYTDGLTESRNHQNEQYDDYRLIKLFELYGSLNASTIRHKIHVALEEFIGDQRLADDITFTCIQRQRKIRRRE